MLQRDINVLNMLNEGEVQWLTEMESTLEAIISLEYRKRFINRQLDNIRNERASIVGRSVLEGVIQLDDYR